MKEFQNSITTDTVPFLSVLIPAYEYPEGIQRILQVLGPMAGPSMEIIIHDDSASDRVQSIVHAWQETNPHPLLYRRNPNPGGAVKNWNGLLAAARGHYLLLLHHDELPLTEGFGKILQHEILSSGSPDILVLDLHLTSRRNAHLHRHVPLWSKRLILRHCPSYLYVRNLIGAPSSWVVRRAHCPVFDERLEWLVDVDWYARTLEGSRSVRVSSQVKVASIEGDYRSITATLKTKIPSLRRKEAEHLSRSGRARLVLWMLRETTPWAKIFRGAESILWAVFRALTTPFLRLIPASTQRDLELRMQIQSLLPPGEIHS